MGALDRGWVNNSTSQREQQLNGPERHLTRNIGDADRTARLLGGAVTGFLFATHRNWGTVSLVLGIVALILLSTAVTAWSPLYAIFRISTLRPDDATGKKA